MRLERGRAILFSKVSTGFRGLCEGCWDSHHRVELRSPAFQNRASRKLRRVSDPRTERIAVSEG